ncbi:hypothetical protein DCC81_07895 [Chitinophaga parva]|uniref:Uncharacterized protein n=1 Tax=Chitinophaga parva TaxID=2169414 RepID=A0A2T7BNX0_9BACT|nr:hypothetical protein [Chitinophaga parva]PUZ29366.1 hypothetical protein DCC81_07895 [Chitinophaga parva]
MGNRSYLYLGKGGPNLFEANNSLPFFWISLLDKSILDNHKPAWEKYDQLEATENETAIDELLGNIPSPLDFAICRAAFDRNTARTTMFLEKHFPHLLPLYNDFVHYVASKFQEGDHVILSALEIAGFHASSVAFLQTLYAETGAIAHDTPTAVHYLFDDDLIASGIGFSSSDDFAGNSPAYREALKARNVVAAPAKGKQATPQKRSAFVTAFILILCPVFTYIVYRGYSKEGVSVTVVMLGLCNIGFYWLGISQLMAVIKGYKGGRR